MNKVKLSDVRINHVQFRDRLDAGLEQRCRAVYDRIRDVDRHSYERFRHGFLCDMHPEREILIWECIAEAVDSSCQIVRGQLLSVLPGTPNPKNVRLFRQEVFDIVVNFTVNGLTENDRNNPDPTLALAVLEYHKAKTSRTEEFAKFSHLDAQSSISESLLTHNQWGRVEYGPGK
jgi:hypothetical protein